MVATEDTTKKVKSLHIKGLRKPIFQKIPRIYTHYTYVVVFWWYFMKQKSYNLQKLEKNRKSLFTEDLKTCILCKRPAVNLHEIYEGRNRQNSMKYDEVLPVCYRCHLEIHRNSVLSSIWKVKGQIAFEKAYPDLDFLSIFGRNYK